MDLNLVRSVVTVVAFLMFGGVVWWAYGRKHRAEFDEAAQLPFESPEGIAPVNTSENAR